MKTTGLFVLIAFVISGCATAPKKEIIENPLPDKKEEAAKPAPMPSLHLDDIYFETGKADLRPEAKTLLKAAVEKLLAEPDRKIEIAGHCDERGTDEYNLDLGWKRAYVVRDYLVRQGIGTDRLFPISYGRARPAVQGTGEEAWEKNRRGALSPR